MTEGDYIVYIDEDRGEPGAMQLLKLGYNGVRMLALAYEKARDAGIPESEITVPYIKCLKREGRTSPFRFRRSDIDAYMAREADSAA